MDLQLGNKIKNILFFTVTFSFLLFGSTYAQVDYVVYNEQNEKWYFSDSNDYIIILKNNKNCLKCFGQLYQYLAENYKSDNMVILSISTIDSSVFARKTEVMSINKLMPGIVTKLFDYNVNNHVTTNYPKSPFLHNNVDITPAIIVKKNNIEHYLPYNEIFNGSNIIDKKLSLLLK